MTSLKRTKTSFQPASRLDFHQDLDVNEMLDNVRSDFSSDEPGDWSGRRGNGSSRGNRTKPIKLGVD